MGAVAVTIRCMIALAFGHTLKAHDCHVAKDRLRDRLRHA